MAACIKKVHLASVWLITSFVICGECCYFTDCPNARYYDINYKPNGKYFFHNWENPEKKTARDNGLPTRKCPSCGIRAMGECFGPTICCTPGHGCVSGENSITAPCRQESHSKQLCTSSVRFCQQRRSRATAANWKLSGVCTKDGLCCNSGGCSESSMCPNARITEHRVSPPDGRSLRAVVRSLLKRQPYLPSTRTGLNRARRSGIVDDNSEPDEE